MTIVERIEQQIQKLSPEELAEFRAWFHEYDWQAWDRKIEGEREGNKLAALAAAALSEHEAGRTKPL
jgi:hypothetical protein